jgi:hypothetical protein
MPGKQFLDTNVLLYEQGDRKRQNNNPQSMMTCKMVDPIVSVTPWLAGICMPVNSLLVVLNALRLTDFKSRESGIGVQDSGNERPKDAPLPLESCPRASLDIFSKSLCNNELMLIRE